MHQELLRLEGAVLRSALYCFFCWRWVETSQTWSVATWRYHPQVLVPLLLQTELQWVQAPVASGSYQPCSKLEFCCPTCVQMASWALRRQHVLYPPGWVLQTTRLVQQTRSLDTMSLTEFSQKPRRIPCAYVCLGYDPLWSCAFPILSNCHSMLGSRTSSGLVWLIARSVGGPPRADMTDLNKSLNRWTFVTPPSTIVHLPAFDDFSWPEREAAPGPCAAANRCCRKVSARSSCPQSLDCSTKTRSDWNWLKHGESWAATTRWS